MKVATQLSKQALLDEAKKRIFNFGSADASDKIAQLNLQYGLAKMLWTLKKRGLDTQDLVAVTTPDSGITRNKDRWQAGFSYGCLLRWPSKQKIGYSLAFPQIKPNACGMLVAKLNNIPSVDDLCHRLHNIEKKGLEVNCEKLKLNVGVSNHFIEVCKVEESQTSKLSVGDTAVVIHTSPSEYKNVLYDFKSWVEKGGSWEETPLGPLLVLEKEQADEYLNLYSQVEEFSFKKRLVLAQALFDEFETITNPTHQGLFDDNEARLGLYKFESEGELFPVTFRWDLHVYLVSSLFNIKEDFLLNQNDNEKQILKGLNMLPHGGGYEIPFKPDGWKVVENGSKRLFAYQNGSSQFIFSSPSELPYYYRGLQVIDEIEKLKLGSVAAKLKQIYTLKY